MPDKTEKNLEEERPATCQQGPALVNLLSNTIGEVRVVPKTSCAKFKEGKTLFYCAIYACLVEG